MTSDLRTSVPLDPAPIERWRRWRGLLAVVGVLVLTAVVLGIVQSRASRGFLDPDGIDPSGSRALVRLLDEQGVEIIPVRSTADVLSATGPADTLLVTTPDMLSAEQIDQIVDTGARLVLIGPDLSLTDFSTGLAAVPVESGTVEPRCDLPAAQRAQAVRLGGYGYPAAANPSQDVGCYPVGGDPTLVSTTSPGGSRTVVLGSGDLMTNEYLDSDGNAALAMGLLGGTDRLVWYRPVPEGTGSNTASLTDHFPDWVRAVSWQLAIAVALAALWRGRRLGRVVTEPLPVVVRASETTEGRARLYRRGRSRDHAATLLREAAGRRLERAGIPASEVAAMLARLTGPPTDDAGLVRLAAELDALELEARQLNAREKTHTP